MTDKDASQKTQALMAALSAVSLAARVQTHEPLTLEFVTRRITRGDRKLAYCALDALEFLGVLAASELNGQCVYRLANEYRE